MRIDDRPVAKLRFALPGKRLRPYVTTYYRTEVTCSKSASYAEDFLHPEWPNIRILPAAICDAAVGPKPMQESPLLSVSGPTSYATRFRLRSSRSWGVGLLPLGWAALFDANAGDYADQTADGLVDPAFAPIGPMANAIAEAKLSFEEELAVIEGHMERLIDAPPNRATAINAINAALVDPELTSVGELAERVDMSIRSLERLCKRTFGFAPKLLMRRQRFLRSLSQFMLDPTMKWLNTLDCQYHDQAHFVRDFKRFMCMSPSTYSKLEKPLLVAAARARMEIAGEAVQGLHDPDKSS